MHRDAVYLSFYYILYYKLWMEGLSTEMLTSFFIIALKNCAEYTCFDINKGLIVLVVGKMELD